MRGDGDREGRRRRRFDADKLDEPGVRSKKSRISRVTLGTLLEIKAEGKRHSRRARLPKKLSRRLKGDIERRMAREIGKS